MIRTAMAIGLTTTLLGSNPLAAQIHDGVRYLDDRMFLLHAAQCTVAQIENGTSETTVYHEDAPHAASWCVVTYRNVEGRPAFRVDHFDSEAEARSYVRQVEPTTPLVSLEGRSPAEPKSYENWLSWKRLHDLQDYDYRDHYAPGGSNAREVIISGAR